EVNSREFVIERSIDGINWSAIKAIPASGHSTVAITYNAIDEKPLKGMNYYRIKLIDQDNRSTLSIVRSVLFSSQYLVLVTPNPATEFININVSGNNTNEVYTVTISDMSGKKLIQTQSSNDVLRIAINKLAKGIYIVQIANVGKIFTQKVIVQ
ncbi:MAG: T9SS type A sorting domain-containing protein, partial [Ferruginibacter sp.]